MDVKITGKIEKAFCGSRNCSIGNCPFSPKYNDGIYVCFAGNNPSENYKVRVDAIQTWLACNDIDDVTEHGHRVALTPVCTDQKWANRLQAWTYSHFIPVRVYLKTNSNLGGLVNKKTKGG